MADHDDPQPAPPAPPPPPSERRPPPTPPRSSIRRKKRNRTIVTTFASLLVVTTIVLAIRVIRLSRLVDGAKKENAKKQQNRRASGGVGPTPSTSSYGDDDDDLDFSAPEHRKQRPTPHAHSIRQSTRPPDPTSSTLTGDAHLAMALKRMPFFDNGYDETASYSSNNDDGNVGGYGYTMAIRALRNRGLGIEGTAVPVRFAHGRGGGGGSGGSGGNGGGGRALGVGAPFGRWDHPPTPRGRTTITGAADGKVAAESKRKRRRRAGRARNDDNQGGKGGEEGDGGSSSSSIVALRDWLYNHAFRTLSHPLRWLLWHDEEKNGAGGRNEEDVFGWRDTRFGSVALSWYKKVTSSLVTFENEDEEGDGSGLLGWLFRHGRRQPRQQRQRREGQRQQQRSPGKEASRGRKGHSKWDVDYRQQQQQQKHRRRHDKDVEALYHLEASAYSGNAEAQYLVASSLASGILPVDNSVQYRPRPSSSSSSSKKEAGGEKAERHTTPTLLSTNLTVPDDFHQGGSQLARALTLWHLSAMDGHVESALSLAYRHYHSASAGGTLNVDQLVTENDLNRAKRHGGRPVGGGSGSRGHHHHAAHGPDDQYGVVGTCESTLAYYSAAVHAMMDEMESSPLRGKVKPALDEHRLAEIHSHGGASVKLREHNKPDELGEAIQYYRMLASRTHQDGPDVQAAFILGKFYHHGHRGVKQDLRLALRYYEIAADHGNWEAAGHAGNFHFWGIGTERDVLQALFYFNKGAPGGAERCLKRHRGEGERTRIRHHRRASRENGDDDDEDYEEDEDYDYDYDDDFFVDEDGVDGGGRLKPCDAACVNGLGLGFLFGVEDLLEPNFLAAKRHFEVASEMNSADANYNLAMFRLGWRGMSTQLPNVDVGGLNDEGDSNDDEGSAKDHAETQRNEDESVGNDDDDEEDEEGVNDYDYEEDEEGENDDEDEDDEEGEKTLKKGDEFITSTRRSFLNSIRSGSQAKDDGAKASVSAESRERKAKSRERKDPRPHNIAGPTKSDYQVAIQLLQAAATEGHIQAKHRLAMMYAHGVVAIPNRQRTDQSVLAVPRSCSKAVKIYMELAKLGTTVSRRNRVAYKQYVAGDYDSSLRNYLAAAETGSKVGQVNAAFLLEQGHCLGLNRDDCVRASVRLWRAAARQNDLEAVLRLGDFAYYGRLRGSTEEHDRDDFAFAGKDAKAFYFTPGPFRWLRYVLYPEELFPLARRSMVQLARSLLSTAVTIAPPQNVDDTNVLPSRTCPADPEDSNGETCVSFEDSQPSAKKGQGRGARNIYEKGDNHLSTAAQYYRKAAKEHSSSRANYNLGFMYEWGLGLKQDFPLAKRHYDLAANDAKLTGQLALMSMNIHETILKVKLALVEWVEGPSPGGKKHIDDAVADAKKRFIDRAAVTERNRLENSASEEELSGKMLSEDIHSRPSPAESSYNNQEEPMADNFLFSDGFESGDFTGLPWSQTGDAHWTLDHTDSSRGRFSATMRTDKLDRGQKALLSLRVDTKSGGKIAFDMLASVEMPWENVRFLVNGDIKHQFAVHTPWAEVAWDIPAGSHTLTWWYEAPAIPLPPIESSAMGQAWLDNVRFVEFPYEGFESGNFDHLPFSQSGDKPWAIDDSEAAEGKYSARSGLVEANEVSTLSLTAEFGVIGGELFFDVMTDTDEAEDSVWFYVDGEKIRPFMGRDRGWETYTHPMSAGEHTLTWSYQNKGSDVQDAVWLDNIHFSTRGRGRIKPTQSHRRDDLKAEAK